MLIAFLLVSFTLNVLAEPGSSVQPIGPHHGPLDGSASAPGSVPSVTPAAGPAPPSTPEPGPVPPGPGSVSEGIVTIPPTPVAGTSQKEDPSGPTANPTLTEPAGLVTQPLSTSTLFDYNSTKNHEILKNYMFTATAFWPVSQLSKYCLQYNLLPAVIPDKQWNDVINTRLNLENEDATHMSEEVPLVNHAAIGLIFDKQKNNFTWLDGKTEFAYDNFRNPKEKDEAPKREKNSYYVQTLHSAPNETGKWLYVNETVFTTVLLCNHK